MPCKVEQKKIYKLPLQNGNFAYKNGIIHGYFGELDYLPSEMTK